MTKTPGIETVGLGDVRLANRCGYCFPNKLPHRGRWAVWYKRGDGAEKALGSPFELAWIDITSGYDRFYKIVHGGFVNSDGGKRLHPTQKPVALFEYLIKTYTKEGDLVLDNCAGSGTTGVACKNTGRNYILIEKEKEYIDIINKRLYD